MAYEDITKAAISAVAVIKRLTLLQILKVALTGLLVIGGWVLWENRQPIYDGLRTNDGVRTMITTPVKDSVKSSISSLLSKQSIIMGVSLVAVNFSTNTRGIVYFDSTNPQFTSAMDSYQQNMLVDPPFFIVGNERNNNRNMALINGDFECYSVADLSTFTPSPNITMYTTYVCSISIPPYPGYFSGYMNVFLSRDPTPADLMEIRSAAKRLSVDVYDIEFSE